VCEESSSGNAAPEPADDDTGSVPRETAGDDWRARLEAAGQLDPDIVDILLSVHGDRGRRAIDAVAEVRIKQYKDFTVVVGHEDEYIVEDGACTCKDTTYNLDADDPEQQCWHALAVTIARRIDAVDHHDMWYTDVREFI
jgi:predicted nucleic acid-binding Zn finger protein